MAYVSVIVPVYNVEDYLARCVDSLLSQTFRDFELILVDDGSPDGCGKICDEYAAQDSRVVVLHKQNGGLSAARNFGMDWVFANSNSRYIAFVDSDDWVECNYLDVLVQGIGMGVNISSVCCRYVYEGEPSPLLDTKKTEYILMTPKEYWLQVNLYMTAWGKLYEKQLWNNVRFPEGKVHEDEYVAHKMLFSGGDIVVCRAPLYCYFQRKDSIMQGGDGTRKIDLIGAFSDQIEFFRDKGIVDLMHQAKVKLLRVYAYAVKTLKKEAYKNDLQELLRIGDVSVLQCPEAYRVLYPIKMLWYWPYLRISDLLARRGLFGAIRQLTKRVF